MPTATNLNQAVDQVVDEDDVVEVATGAGLVYTSDEVPGIRRRRQGKGFTYVDAKGKTVGDESERERIRDLVIPPAWTDVWISPDPKGHLLATGRDARGRKQYRYHPEWRRVRDESKYDRLADFGAALPDLRDAVDADLRRQGMGREKVLALVIRLLDRTLVRVGNAEYAEENESFGLTTLRSDHVELTGRRATFSFVAKGGAEQEVEVRDAALARAVRRCHELGGQELFAYEDEDGTVVDVTSNDVNARLGELAGPWATAKTFRTWGGTTVAAGSLAEAGAPESEAEADATIIEAIDEAAAALGNTRAVCRGSYVHPAIPEAYRTGDLASEWSSVRRGKRLDRAERLVLAVLD
jgi:DNA topoisomerase-1